MPKQSCMLIALSINFCYRWLGVIIYLTFLFLVIVVLLNLLIAQMSDTYTNVQQDAQRSLVLSWGWIVAKMEHHSMLYKVMVSISLKGQS